MWGGRFSNIREVPQQSQQTHREVPGRLIGRCREVSYQIYRDVLSSPGITLAL
jgi:hypothetical protein